jgi:flagellar hook-associated protein 2
MEIFVDEKNSSLNAVAGLLNTYPDSPVQASVVKDLSDPDKPWRLIVSAKKDGTDDEIHFPEFYFLDGKEDFYIDGTKNAENALLSLDGFPIEADGNQIKDFLQGINLNLKQARPDQPFTINIAADTQKIAGKVKSLVEQINTTLDFINKQNQVDEKTDTRSSFAGDSSLQGIEYRIRNLLHDGFPIRSKDGASYKIVHLNEIGVEFKRDGLLEFKEEKFKKLVENDFEGIAEAITGEAGLATRLKDIVDSYTRTGEGMMQLREQSIRSKIKNLDTQIAQKERRLEQRQQSLTDQFARLQGSLSDMQKQSQYISATLGGGGGNMISQLLGG